jgi:hypothetical protein
VWPLRLIDHNPLPRGFLPKVGTSKAKVYVYPTEDAQLLARTTVPLWRRMLWGVLAREGMREGELISLTWSCLDLERGVLTLDENKTDDPRAWAMNPGVVRALIAWKKIHPDPKANKPVIIEENGGVIDGKPFARLLRADLKRAKVKRAELYLEGKNRLMIRAHDLRGTFVTLSLANNRTEAWVQDRTGHTSSNMINLYRRTARTAAELGLGELLPLDEAIPELRRKGPTKSTNGRSGAAKTPSGESPGDLSRETDPSCLASVSRGSKDGSDGWIRTTVRGIKILCPAIRRRRSERRQRTAASGEVQGVTIAVGAPGGPAVLLGR